MIEMPIHGRGWITSAHISVHILDTNFQFTRHHRRALRARYLVF